MAGEITHDEYYLMLGDAIRVTPSMLPRYTKEQYREYLAADKHLNNVRLPEWDAKDYIVRQKFHENMKAAMPITGSNGWSLSDTVCVLKCLARRWAHSPD